LQLQVGDADTVERVVLGALFAHRAVQLKPFRQYTKACSPLAAIGKPDSPLIAAARAYW